MIDNLTDAISRARGEAQKLKKKVEGYSDKPYDFNSAVKKNCLERASEYEQLADWLTELQFRRTPCATCEEFDDCENCTYYKKCHKGVIDEDEVSEWIEDIDAKREKYKESEK